MFIAMNNFKVAKGQEADFERTWRERKSYLQGVPGFVQFALLKSDAEGEYVSHSTWQGREAGSEGAEPSQAEAWPSGTKGTSREPLVERGRRPRRRRRGDRGRVGARSERPLPPGLRPVG